MSEKRGGEQRREGGREQGVGLGSGHEAGEGTVEEGHVRPGAITLVTLRCKLKSRSGLALGPPRAPEYESRPNCRSRVHLPTFSCRFDHPEWWSPAEVRGSVDVDSLDP